MGESGSLRGELPTLRRKLGIAVGAPVSDMRRDPRLARSLMATAVSQHVTLAVKWRGLRDPYRQALVRGSSEESWRGFFDAR